MPKFCPHCQVITGQYPLWNCTHSVGTVPLHPKYCGFSLLWFCVSAVPSKPRWDRAFWPGCRELWLRTVWMSGAMTTRHGCSGDRGMGAMRCGRGVCTSGATKVPLWVVSAMWLPGAIAAYANIGELAWVPAGQGLKQGSLPKLIFRICAMAVCSPHHHIFTWFISNQGKKLCFAQNQFSLNLEKAQRRDCSLSWKFPLPLCHTLSHRSTNPFLQGELHAFTFTCAAVLCGY